MRIKQLLAASGLTLLIAACGEDLPNPTTLRANQLAEAVELEASLPEEPSGPQLSVDPERLVQTPGGPVFVGEGSFGERPRYVTAHQETLYALIERRENADERSFELYTAQDGLKWKLEEAVSDQPWANRLHTVMNLDGELVLGVIDEDAFDERFPEPDLHAYVRRSDGTFERDESKEPIPPRYIRRSARVLEPDNIGRGGGGQPEFIGALDNPTIFLATEDDGTVWVARGDGEWAKILERSNNPRLEASTDDYFIISERSSPNLLRFDWPAQPTHIDYWLRLEHGAPIACNAPASRADEINVGAPMSDGRILDLEVVTRTQTSRDSPDQPFGDISLERSQLRIARTDEGWRAFWDHKSTQVDVRDHFGDITDLLLDQPVIEYPLAVDGYYDGSISNADELRDTLVNQVAELFVGEDPELAQLVVDGYQNASDQEISDLLADDVLQFHLYDGYSFELGSRDTYRDQLPTALGNESFDATITLEAASELDADGCVMIRETAEYDPFPIEKISQIAGEFFDTTAPELALQAGEPETATLTRTLDARIDPASGRVRTVTQVVEFRSGAQWTRDTTIIRDVTPEEII